jgi:hypothetical protein
MAGLLYSTVSYESGEEKKETQRKGTEKWEGGQIDRNR